MWRLGPAPGVNDVNTHLDQLHRQYDRPSLREFQSMRDGARPESLLPFHAAADSLAAQMPAFPASRQGAPHHALLTITAARKAVWLLQFLGPSLRDAVTAAG